MNAINPLAPAPSTDGEARAVEPSMEEILASIRRIIADDQTLPSRSASRDAAPIIEALRADGGPVPAEPSPPRRSDPAPVDRAPADAVVAITADRVGGAAPSSRDDDAQSHSAYPGHGQIAPQFPMPDGPVPDATPAQPSHQRPVLTPFFAAATQAFDAGRDHSSPIEGLASRERPMPARPPEVEPRRAPDGPVAVAPDLISTQAHQSVSSAFNMLAATRLADNSEELLDLAREMIRPLLKSWIDDNLPTMVERLVRAEIERVARGGR